MSVVQPFSFSLQIVARLSMAAAASPSVSAPPALQRVPVVLLGYGNVGQALLTQIQSQWESPPHSSAG
jgi:hypothetical protein